MAQSEASSMGTAALDAIVDAAMRLAAERSWSDISLADIASEAEINLGDLRSKIEHKSDILAAFVKRIDQVVLADVAARQKTDAPRDALFEVLMNRFDALEPYKAAMKSIVGPSAIDLRLVAPLLESQTWMLQAASIDTAGLKGTARVLGLSSLSASVFRTWLEDDDPGLAKTMAVLDRRLRRGERSMKSAETVLDAGEGACKLVASLISNSPFRTPPKREPSQPAGGFEGRDGSATAG